MSELHLAEKPKEVPSIKRVDPYSPLWASTVKPFALMVFLLVLIVILAPFISLPWIKGLSSNTRASIIVDWGRAVLPSVVGFAAAVIGYYFGTRSDKSDLEE